MALGDLVRTGFGRLARLLKNDLPPAEVVTLADVNGDLLGSVANPLPVSVVGAAGDVVVNVDNATISVPAPTVTNTRRLASSAANTNPTSVKGAAGYVFKVTGDNTVASKRYLKFYDKATAPVVGTDAPIWVEVLPASGKFELSFGGGKLEFATGIAFGISAGAADADATALGAGDIACLNVGYA